jgi:hypothetical protein
MSSSWFGGSGDVLAHNYMGLYGAIDGYGSLNLTEQSPSQTFIEPLTLQEVAQYLRISLRSDDTESDEANEILGYIMSAREQAEIMQNKDLVRKQYDLTFDYWMSYRIRLRFPLASVDLVQFTDWEQNVTTLQQGTDYIADLTKNPGTISPPYNGTWPTFTPFPSSALLIRFTSGYLSTDPFWRDAGARVKIGMKLLISGWINNKIPYEIGSSQAAEYPFSVSSCLGYGAKVRAM